MIYCLLLKELHSKNPELVSRFQKATLRGYEYAFSNINETIGLIQKEYNSQNKSFQALAYEAKVLKELSSMGGGPLGNIDERKLKRIQDIYGLMGLMKKDIDFKDFFFDTKKIYLSKEEKDFIKNTTL
jgi:ABC-type nitrate/sulfonate/bicarbonate transport system substrate-binding protein